MRPTDNFLESFRANPTVDQADKVVDVIYHQRSEIATLKEMLSHYRATVAIQEDEINTLRSRISVLDQKLINKFSKEN